MWFGVFLFVIIARSIQHGSPAAVRTGYREVIACLSLRDVNKDRSGDKPAITIARKRFDGTMAHTPASRTRAAVRIAGSASQAADSSTAPRRTENDAARPWTGERLAAALD